jgi:DNA-binding NarL/FixJ family response regulator
MFDNFGYILIVDDDPGCRALLHDLLAGAGHEVRDAQSGAEALTAAREERPRLVLLDVYLPGMSGYQVLHKLRDEFGALPVIFISGKRTEPFDRTGGLMLGADDYIVKPFDHDELLARVERYLRGAPASTPSVDDTGARALGLTRREQQILALLAAGRKSEDISHDLFITRKTVSAHIQNILAKLDVHSQAQAIALAFRSNLVHTPLGN